MNKSKDQLNKEKNQDLENAKKERDEYLDGWKRAKADLINFKKETQELIIGLSSFAKANFLSSLLPLIDSIEQAAASGIQGIENIKSLLAHTLKEEGIEEICPKEGDEFDAKFHEAIEGEGSLISKVLQKGYRLGEKVVRPARVAVKNS